MKNCKVYVTLPELKRFCLDVALRNGHSTQPTQPSDYRCASATYDCICYVTDTLPHGVTLAFHDSELARNCVPTDLESFLKILKKGPPIPPPAPVVQPKTKANNKKTVASVEVILKALEQAISTAKTLKEELEEARPAKKVEPLPF